MIDSTHNSSNSARIPQLNNAHSRTQKAPEHQSQSPASGDQISVSSSSQLREALQGTPVVRPEVVERARALVVSPNYPPVEIIERIAKDLLSSPDPMAQS